MPPPPGWPGLMTGLALVSTGMGHPQGYTEAGSFLVMKTLQGHHQVDGTFHYYLDARTIVFYSKQFSNAFPPSPQRAQKQTLDRTNRISNEE